MRYVLRFKGRYYSTGSDKPVDSLKEATRFYDEAGANYARSILTSEWRRNARIVPLKPKPKPYAPGSFTVGVSRVDTKECDGPRFDLLINSEVVDSLTSADAANIRAGRILRALKKTLAVALAIPMPVVELVQEPAISWSVVKVNGVDISTTNNQDHQKAIAANLRKALGSPPPVKPEPKVDVVLEDYAHVVRINGASIARFSGYVSANEHANAIRKALDLPAVAT